MFENMQQFLQSKGGLSQDNSSPEELQALLKAISAGQVTGAETWNSTTHGPSLKVESLEPTLKVLTNTMKDIVVFNKLPKDTAFNTVEEYNQLSDYGNDGIGAFTDEGETPIQQDSDYVRRSTLIKFMGTQGKVTHPATLVKVQSGVGSMLQQEIQNRTMWLLRQIDKATAHGNSSIISQQFDGFYKLHFDGVTNFAFDLDKYFDSDVVIDAGGYRLDDDMVEAASLGVRQNFGYPGDLVTSHRVMSNYVKNFHESKFVQPVASQVQNGVFGQRVNRIVTEFGDLGISTDRFWQEGDAVTSTQAAAGADAPAKPTKDASTPVAVVTDASSKFARSAAGMGAGDYFYGVRAVNKGGTSAMELLNASAQAVTATQSVNLKFGAVTGATGYIIYRSKADDVNGKSNMYPIFKISAAQLTAGYDGGAAGLVRDRNRYLPGTDKATISQWDSQVINLKQLAPLMKMDLAITGPAYPFMILAYMAMQLYAPKKAAVIVNIGTAAK
jgi:hypothetical protein